MPTGQDQPHTQGHSDVATDALDMQRSRNPTPADTGNDPNLNGDTDGAQTAGDRSYHQNLSSSLPQGLAEGTADIGATDIQMPTDGGHGASNASGSEERKQQEKVINS